MFNVIFGMQVSRFSSKFEFLFKGLFGFLPKFEIIYLQCVFVYSFHWAVIVFCSFRTSFFFKYVLHISFHMIRLIFCGSVNVFTWLDSLLRFLINSMVFVCFCFCCCKLSIRITHECLHVRTFALTYVSVYSFNRTTQQTIQWYELMISFCYWSVHNLVVVTAVVAATFSAIHFVRVRKISFMVIMVKWCKRFKVFISFYANQLFIHWVFALVCALPLPLPPQLLWRSCDGIYKSKRITNNQ